MADGTGKSDSGIRLGFFSNALEGDDIGLHLIGVRGKEELSRLFEYDLLLKRPGEPLTEKQMAELCSSSSVISLGPSGHDMVHGRIIEIEHLDGTRNVAPHYRAKLVPVTSLMDRAQRSSIYQNLTVPAIAEKLLKAYGLTQGENFVIKVYGDVKPREYAVQYQETDWAFMQRWLEHHGFFYWFKHGPAGSVLTIADENADATPLEGTSELSYRERNNLAADSATIWDFRVRHRRVPHDVTVVDYNYRNPGAMLVASHAAAEDGFGRVYYYGEHFKTKPEGEWIAKMRSELHVAERRVVTGWTDCARMHVGHTFKLENHHVEEYNEEYLVTAIRVKVGYDIDLASVPSHVKVEQVLHRLNVEFDALPKSVAFRPERRTPWPRIHGVMTGHVDADTLGALAFLDEEGRYKVKLPFYVGSKEGSAVSRPIRMAQNYAGAAYGTHHPLHKGAEVLIVHIDGDPDRPIIVGAVPNPHTPSPVTKSNASQSVVETASGIRIEYEDSQS